MLHKDKRIVTFAAMATILAIICLAIGTSIAEAKTETFGVISDTHARGEGDNWDVTTNADTVRALNWVKNRSNLVGVIHAGDIGDRGVPGDFNMFLSLWRNSGLRVPYIAVMGNHDYNNGGSWDGLSAAYCEDNFKRIINHGVLNSYSEFANANIMTLGGAYTQSGSRLYTDSQLKQLNKRLRKTARSGKWAIVVCHYPYYTSYKNSRKLAGILRAYPNVIYISGHRHYYSNSQHFYKNATPSATTTSYKRTGIDVKKKKYSFLFIGQDSVSRNHDDGSGVWRSSGQSVASTLTIDGKGKVTYLYKNLAFGGTKSWSKAKTFGSIVVKCKATTNGSTLKSMKYQITFSDGKTYGGVKSGGTFSLALNKSKTFSNIPAGVLVKITPKTSASGWNKPAAQSLEVTNKKRTATFSHVFTPKYWTITYKGLKSGSKAPSKTKFKSADATFKLANATNPSGYVFTGWYTKELGGTKVTQIKKGTKKNIIVYARYKAVQTSNNQASNNGASNSNNVSSSKSTAITSVKYGWIALDKNKKPILQGSQYKLSGTVKPVAYISNGVTMKPVTSQSVVYLSNTKVGTAQALVIGSKIPGFKDAFITNFTIVK